MAGVLIGATRHGGRLFDVVSRVLAMLRRLGTPAALSRMDARAANGYAAAIAYMLRARAWTLLRGEPRGRAIRAAWARAAAEGSRAPHDHRLALGDRVRLIADGEAAFAERAALYAGASARIDIATYYVQADETGWATVRALAACAARGVRVRLLVDGFMTFRKTQEIAGMQELLAAIRASGIALQVWNDPRRPYDSNHRKMIVVDRRVALVGGRNVADHYRGNAWRDVDLVLEGPSVRPLAAVFDGVWAAAESGGDRPHSAGPWVDSVPADIAADPVVGAVLAAIRGAGRRVDLELAYFVALEPLCAEIVRAARRGVRVRLLTNSLESTDLPYLAWTAYAGMRRLLAAGCEVYARRGAGRTLHCKYVVVDGEWVSFGSHNLDYYSARYCCETNLLARDAALGAALEECFETGVADATPVTLEEARDVCRRTRMFRAFDLVFRDFQ